VESWSVGNIYCRVTRDTFELYVLLHLPLLELANTQGFDYAMVVVKHFSHLLERTRVTSPSHLVCMVRVYLVLQDAKVNSFHLVKLQEKRNLEFKTKWDTLSAGGGSGTSCKKCGGPAHPNGLSGCPFKALSDVKAQECDQMVMLWIGGLTDAQWS